MDLYLFNTQETETMLIKPLCFLEQEYLTEEESVMDFLYPAEEDEDEDDEIIDESPDEDDEDIDEDEEEEYQFIDQQGV